MIASLIYFALYPLTKLIERVSGLCWTTPCVYINGRELGDGRGAPSRRLPELQTDQLQHCHNTTRTIPGPEDTERERTRGMGRAPPEMQSRREQELDEEATYDDGQPAMEENPAAVTEHERPSKWTENMEEIKEVELTASAGGCQDVTSDHVVHFIQEPQVMQDDTTPPTSEPDRADVSDVSAGPTAELCVGDKGTEDGDKDACCYEMLLGFDSEDGSEVPFVTSHPVFDLRALLADSSFVQAPAEPVGWHFPAGVGLSDLCFCPYVQFPSVSYYPVFQDNNNIEVTWRLWEDLQEAGDEPRAGAFEFSIMSYNILAQDLLEAHPELYTHCLEEALVWEYRLHLLLRELHVWMPDVLCLQEVQENHFQKQMYPVLTEMGYTCVYKRRTGIRTDGCAVCYQSQRFTQLSANLLEFYRPDCELLDRDNVGIALLLQPITEQGEALSPICVANTHLLFNPRRGDVKLAQLAILLAEIDMMMKKCKRQGRSCEVVLCGDFNALPGTPLLNFITGGQLYYHGLPDWMVSGQVDLSRKLHHNRLCAPLWPDRLGIDANCQYAVYSDSRTNRSEKLKYSPDFLHQLRFCQASCVRPPGLVFIPGVTDNTPDGKKIQMFSSSSRHTLFHGLKLTSAYPDTHPITHKCVLTTLNSEGGAMVDYIFYSTPAHNDAHGKEKDGGLKLLGRLSLLSEADLLSFKGLPNETFPSDHLSLVAKFQLS